MMTYHSKDVFKNVLYLVCPMKIEIERTLSAKFVIKTQLCDCCFVAVLHYLQMSIVKHFSAGSVKYKFGNKGEVES